MTTASECAERKLERVLPYDTDNIASGPPGTPIIKLCPAEREHRHNDCEHSSWRPLHRQVSLAVVEARLILLDAGEEVWRLQMVLAAEV